MLRDRAVLNACAARGHHRLSGVFRALESDLLRYWARSGIAGPRAVTAGRWASALLDPAFACLLVHRLAHWACANGVPLLPRLLSAFNRLVFRINITPVSCVGGGWSVRHPAGVHFHGVAGTDLTLFAYAVCIAATAPLGGDLAGAPTLGDRVSIGALGAVIGGVEVGCDVDIGFRTIVAANVPDGSVVVSDASRVRRHPRPVR